MGTNALSLKQGACVADIMLAETKRAMVEHANQVIVVCDHSKLSNTSLAQFASLPRSTLSCWIACRKTRRPIRMPASRC